jgi:hypothetical protein
MFLRFFSIFENKKNLSKFEYDDNVIWLLNMVMTYKKFDYKKCRQKTSMGNNQMASPGVNPIGLTSTVLFSQ